MQGAVLLNPVVYECPSCGLRHLPDEMPAPNRAPMHSCPALLGVLAPLVPEGVRARHVAVEREDFVGRELVRKNSAGRPVMAVRTERSDGSNDCTVFAPAATIKEDR